MKKKYTRKKLGTDWKRLKGMKDQEIDFSDIPQVDRAEFRKMVIRMPQKKSAVSIRLDPEVIKWFKKRGCRYQTRINAVLRSYVEAHTH